MNRDEKFRCAVLRWASGRRPKESIPLLKRRRPRGEVDEPTRMSAPATPESMR